MSYEVLFENVSEDFSDTSNVPTRFTVNFFVKATLQDWTEWLDHTKAPSRASCMQALAAEMRMAADHIESEAAKLPPYRLVQRP